jgi:PKD repeat protein
VPLLVSFTDQSTNPVTSWAWDFGDGGTSTLQNPTHTYTAAGSYTVALTVSGPGGADTETQSGYVIVSEPAPVAEFSGTPLSGAAPLDVAFTDLSTGPITTWAWTFGDGGSSGLPSPQHVYTTGGSFAVSLTVTGPGGSDTTTKTAYVTVSAGAFVPYGSGSGGAAGVPVLAGAGDLTPGSVPGFDLSLGSGPPLAPIILFVGPASASVPLKGQTLLVFPIVTQIGLGATNGAGAMTLHSKVPAGTPALSVYLQAWLVDPTGTSGFSSTNGLRLDVP